MLPIGRLFQLIFSDQKKFEEKFALTSENDYQDYPFMNNVNSTPFCMNQHYRKRFFDVRFISPILSQFSSIGKQLLCFNLRMDVPN